MPEVLEERKPYAGIGVAGATYSLIMTAVGAGILSVPEEFGKVGWVPGISLLVALSLAALSAAHLLNKLVTMPLANKKDGQPLPNFVEIGRHAFGLPGAIYSELCMLGIMVFVGSIILWIMGSSLLALCDSLSRQQWILIIALVVSPLACISKGSHMNLIASIGVYSLIVILFLCVSVSIAHIAENGYEETQLFAEADPPTWGGVCTTIIFSFGASGIIPALNQDCRDAKRTVPKALNLSFLLMLVFYVIVAACGYLAYGDTDITSAVAPTSHKDWVFYVVRGMMQVMGMMHYIVVLVPVNKSAERFTLYLFAPSSAKKEIIFSACARVLVVATTASIACVSLTLPGLVTMAGGTFGILLLFVNPIVTYIQFLRINRKAKEQAISQSPSITGSAKVPGLDAEGGSSPSPLSASRSQLRADLAELPSSLPLYQLCGFVLALCVSFVLMVLGTWHGVELQMKMAKNLQAA